MPQEKHTEETELSEPAPEPNLHADEHPGGGGIGGRPRKEIDLSGFPEDCGGYGVDDKPRSMPMPNFTA